MAMFVHLAPESRIALIRRNGIRRLRRAAGEFPGGVFAVPVTRNFYISHQWLRELKRRNEGRSRASTFGFRMTNRSGWGTTVRHIAGCRRLKPWRSLSQPRTRAAEKSLFRGASRRERFTARGVFPRSSGGDSRPERKAIGRSARASSARAVNTEPVGCALGWPRRMRSGCRHERPQRITSMVCRAVRWRMGASLRH